MSFVAIIDAEIADLERKLSALRVARAAYVGEVEKPRATAIIAPAPAAVKAPMHYGGGLARAPRRSEKSAQVLDLAQQYVEAHAGVPVPTADLLSFIELNNVKVEGKNPRNALSALLSNSGMFKANGRSGWTLASADHSQNDEAADAAIPRQDASTASFEPRLINEETPQRGYGEPQQRPGGGG